jgi:hypothetical protein
MAREEIHKDFDRLVSRYLSGELSPEELAWFQEELGKDPEKKDLLDSYQLIWDSAAPDETYHLDSEWDLLQKKIPGFKADSLPLREMGVGRRLQYYSYRIAAILVR